MNKQEYNSCLATGLRGKTLGKEERKTEFCVVSKVCSKKASTREEALRLCSLPKPPKPESMHRHGRRAVDTCDISHCVQKIDILVQEGQLPLATDPEFICKAIFKK